MAISAMKPHVFSSPSARRASVIAAAGPTKKLKSPTAAPKVAKSESTSSKSESTATGLAVLARVEQLKLLSKVEELGLLSRLESSGLTLSKIEELGLLSTAEKLGLLSLLADSNTPGLLNFAGLLALAGAAATVFLVPDETTTEVVAQVVGGVLLASAGAALFSVSSILSKFQKL